MLKSSSSLSSEARSAQPLKLLLWRNRCLVPGRKLLEAFLVVWVVWVDRSYSGGTAEVVASGELPAHGRDPSYGRGSEDEGRPRASRDAQKAGRRHGEQYCCALGVELRAESRYLRGEVV